MFQLTKEEFAALRSQIVILEKGKGRYPKYLPYMFTEQGIAMLSTVLNSERAIKVNIEIMRAFVRLARNLRALENKYDEQFKVVFEAIYKLMETPETEKSVGSCLNRLLKNCQLVSF